MKIGDVFISGEAAVTDLKFKVVQAYAEQEKKNGKVKSSRMILKIENLNILKEDYREGLYHRLRYFEITKEKFNNLIERKVIKHDTK